ncbi:hypothetical protein Tco_1416919 [Tanacetum coccineum]
MDSDKYLEGQSMQRPPLFESDNFFYWKNRFETYVKSKDLDLWHVITEGDFQRIQNNSKTKLDEVVPFEKQNDDFKKRLAKNNEAKMIIKKDSKIVKAKGERRSLALNAKNESSDEECSTSGSEDEEYAIAVRDFKKFFKRRGRCGDPNHLIGECLKPPKDKNQRAFFRGSWSNSGEEDDEKVKDETCLMAHASSEKNKPDNNL